jgi:hypothetical protein
MLESLSIIFKEKHWNRGGKEERGNCLERQMGQIWPYRQLFALTIFREGSQGFCRTDRGR